jgi:hypothetical protein
MTLQELLTANGIEEATATKILADMKENKIYTTSVENADTRYSKLKEKHEALTGELDTANKAIEDFKNANPEELKNNYEALKGEYETFKADSEKKLKGQAIDYSIKEMMKANKAKAKYADLLQAKIDKESLQLAENGGVEGLEDIFKGLKEEYADLFEQEQPQLRGTPPANNGSSGSENSALREQIKAVMNRR